uniref:Uncharacterized protein n=1 Tax=Peronospora matthiolae TaxID=2874970 RepID=A0AAV1U942_9STRA
MVAAVSCLSFVLQAAFVPVGQVERDWDCSERSDGNVSADDEETNG